MDDDILSRVVEVEREVQQRLDVEKKMSLDWIEKVKKEAEERVVAEEKKLKEEMGQDLQKAKLEAEKGAAAIIEDAHDEAARLRDIGDEILKKTIRKHLSTILPGH
ncbi:MAG: hypothetical protein JSU90_01335 [Nitrospiraceae bacterium]|nr:MAG: hypothetical protein JSU90_01335 [Nitrospiraceae bacterium]